MGKPSFQCLAKILMRTNNKLNPHLTPRLVMEPGQHWWEASGLTTVPSLLPMQLHVIGVITQSVSLMSYSECSGPVIW